MDKPTPATLKRGVAVAFVLLLVASGAFAATQQTLIAEFSGDDWDNANTSQGVIVDADTQSGNKQVRLTGQYFDKYQTNPIGVQNRITVSSGITYDSGKEALVHGSGVSGGWGDNIAFADPFDGRTSGEVWMQVNGTFPGVLVKAKKNNNDADRVRMVMRSNDDEIRIGYDTPGGPIQQLDATVTNQTLSSDTKYWLNARLNKTADEVYLAIYTDNAGQPGDPIGVATASYSATPLGSHSDLYWGFTSNSASGTDDYAYGWGITTGTATTEWKSVPEGNIITQLKATSTTGAHYVRNAGQPSTVQDTITVPNGNPTFEYGNLADDSANYSVAVLANDQSADGSTNTNWTAAGGSSIIRSPEDGHYYILVRHRYADGGSKRGLEYEIVKNNTNNWDGPEDWDSVFTEDMSDVTQSVEVGQLRYFNGKYYMYISWSDSSSLWTVSYITSETVAGLQTELNDKANWTHVVGANANKGFNNRKDGRVYETNGEYYLVTDSPSGSEKLFKSTSGGVNFTTVESLGNPIQPFLDNEQDTITITNDGMAMYDDENDRYVYWFSWQNGTQSTFSGFITAQTLGGFPDGTYAGSIYMDESDTESGDFRYADYYSVDNNSQVFTFEWDPDEDKVRDLYIWDYRDDPGGAATGRVPAIDSENATVNATIQVSPDQNTISDSYTVQLSGKDNETFENLDDNLASDDYVRIKSEFSVADYASVAAGVEDYTLLEVTDEAAPSISNPFPTGERSDVPDQLSVRVEDSNFDDGDTVNVSFWHNGNYLTSKTIGSNQTVQADPGSVDAGQNSWRVNATDSTGRTVEQSYSYSIGDKIFIRPENNETEIINDTEIEATFYSLEDNTIYETTTNDGTINVSGLPVQGQFIITLNADGYYPRTGYSKGVLESASMYLLNSTAYPNAPATVFELDDRTGRFASEDTVIVISRAFDPDRDGSEQYDPVAGDFFGASGTFTFTGESDVRYQIEVQNIETGDTRLLGPYTPKVDTSRTLTIGQVSWPALNGSATYFDVNKTDLSGNDTRLRLKYQDAGGDTTELCYTVRDRFNESKTYAADCNTGTYGKFTADVVVNDSVVSDGIKVTYNATNSTGSVKSGSRTIGNPGLGIPIDSRWLGSIVLVFIPMVGLLYGSRTAVLGTWVMVAMVAATMMFSLINIPPVSLGAAVIVTFGATLRANRVERGGLP